MKTISHLRLVPRVRDKRQGFLCVRNVLFACAIGRSGFATQKREGDGATPMFAMNLRQVFYRKDRHFRPETQLKVQAIKPDDMWQDDVTSRNYNRLVKKNTSQSDEILTREDHLYDYIIPLGWNDKPIAKHKGSAIFWHGARAGFTPTAGCVATSLTHIKQLLPRLSPKTVIMPFAVSRRKGRYQP